MGAILLTDTASSNAMSGGGSDDRGETHFEWLARRVLEQDRRIAPFTYGERTDRAERRRWDLRTALFATDRTRRALLQDG